MPRHQKIVRLVRTPAARARAEGGIVKMLRRSLHEAESGNVVAFCGLAILSDGAFATFCEGTSGALEIVGGLEYLKEHLLREGLSGVNKESEG